MSSARVRFSLYSRLPWFESFAKLTIPGVCLDAYFKPRRAGTNSQITNASLAGLTTRQLHMHSCMKVPARQREWTKPYAYCMGDKSQRNRKGRRYSTAPSLPAQPLHFQKQGNSRAVHLGIAFATLQQFCGLPQVLHFIIFTIKHATRERVGGCRCFLHTAAQIPQTVINGCFGSCVFAGGPSAAFSPVLPLLHAEARWSSGALSFVQRRLPRAVPCSC